MGWTLFACFGCINDKKRPPSSRLGSKGKRIKGYQQIQADVLEEFDEVLRDEPNDEKKARIRKKVRFNLDNVIVYEPISDCDTGNLQEDPDENVSDKQASCLVYASKKAKQSFPADYRYNNSCYGDEDYSDEVADEDEDNEFELSDLEDEDEDYCDLSSKPLISSTDKGLRTTTDAQPYVQHRRHYVVSVLNPVENLSQWKAIKARNC